jgi:hypothetical protein
MAREAALGHLPKIERLPRGMGFVESNCTHASRSDDATHPFYEIDFGSLLLGDELRRRVEDGLDVVAIGIEDKGRVVVAAVLGTNTRPADVCAAVARCGVVPA